ncbi:MAG: sulfur carrier protein ThiS [Chlorobiaceae bacterium]
MITIELNGKEQRLKAGSSVSNLFSIVGCDDKNVAIVVNEKIIRPENRSILLLEEGDRVEILVFAGGG